MVWIRIMRHSITIISIIATGLRNLTTNLNPSIISPGDILAVSRYSSTVIVPFAGYVVVGYAAPEVVGC
jgi:hypothetical protein